ncbi:MAG: hypothetical protein FD153_1432, partial [Rhodospirillaceae bacterium]
MTLLELRAYLSRCGRASVAEIATHFDSSPAVVLDLVGRWETHHRAAAREKWLQIMRKGLWLRQRAC